MQKINTATHNLKDKHNGENLITIYYVVNNVNVLQHALIVAVLYTTKRVFESMTATVFISKRYATIEAEIGSNLKRT